MPFSDEFDLDLVTSGNGIPGGNQPQSTSSEVSWAVSSLIIGSVLSSPMRNTKATPSSTRPTSETACQRRS